MRGGLFFQRNLFFSQKSLKFGQNANIIDMTPLMTTVHYVFQSDGTLLWIIILMWAAIFAFAAVIVCVRAVKYMIIELYEGIKLAHGKKAVFVG